MKCFTMLDFRISLYDKDLFFGGHGRDGAVAGGGDAGGLIGHSNDLLQLLGGNIVQSVETVPDPDYKHILRSTK